MEDALSEIFDEPEFRNPNDIAGAAFPESFFGILETLEDEAAGDILTFTPFEEAQVESQPLNPANGIRHDTDDDEDETAGVRRKKLKLTAPAEADEDDGLQKMSHITVERNRRKQMNEHLHVLRSLMPCFYVKRGDQASIIEGVVDYIKELQQVLKSMEAKKQRKVYSEVLSPRPPLLPVSPRPPLPQASPRPSPLCSPRIGLVISPKTPQPGSPYKPLAQQTSSHESSPAMEIHTELAANSKSHVAEVEVKFSGANVLLKTISSRIPGQAVRIIAVLEGLALEILHVSISAIEDTMVFSFTIKIGIECELSAEELAQEVQLTFS